MIVIKLIMMHNNYEKSLIILLHLSMIKKNNKKIQTKTRVLTMRINDRKLISFVF